MALVRRSIYALSLPEVQRLTNALNVLKQSGIYDEFTIEHRKAMDILTPAGESGTLRNAAHRGPSLLPWHRQFLLKFEHRLQDVAPGITVPYWPWELDAAMSDPRQAAIWSTNYLGPNGNPADSWYVTTGPFASWRAIIFNSTTGQFEPRSRTGLIRSLGTYWSATTLPTLAHVNNAKLQTKYDDSPWNEVQWASPSFRNRLEGFLLASGEPTNQPRLHNRVHVWVGGDMNAGTSPNDPIFWLHHSNVDRIWASWQANGHAQDYLPVSGGPAGHNLNDRLKGFELSGPTPADLLDIAKLGYSYA